MKQYLQATTLLDFNTPVIQQLIANKQWGKLNVQEQILSIYNFVRDDIQFGFNALDTIPASEILKEGIGQCNTKSILFMALLRAIGVPCRIHGFTISKTVQAGIMKGELYDMMPDEISHTWTEIYFNEKWHNMEGLILDVPYLSGVQKKFNSTKEPFSGYAIATPDLNNPQVYWNGKNDTYIQKDGIVKNFGLFDDPDDFFAQHAQNMSEEQVKLFGDVYRHKINENICEIRNFNF